jgi:biopolymer transport protein ExbD
MSANFGGGGNGQEVELNITPIIDCFTVLITFLLASASFLSIGFFEAYTPGSNSDPTQVEPDTEVVLKLKANHMAEFKVKGKRNETITFSTVDPSSLKNLEQQLQNLKDPSIKLSQILVSAEDSVDYKELSDLMGHINTLNLPIVVGDF